MGSESGANDRPDGSPARAARPLARGQPTGRRPLSLARPAPASVMAVCHRQRQERNAACLPLGSGVCTHTIEYLWLYAASTMCVPYKVGLAVAADNGFTVRWLAFVCSYLRRRMMSSTLSTRDAITG